MEVYDKIAEGKYDNPLPLPDGTSFREVHILEKGKTVYRGVAHIGTINKTLGVNLGEIPFRALIQEVEGLGYLIEVIYDENAFKAAQKLHRETTQRLLEIFEEDLYMAFKVKDNPRREKVFKLAWNYGHAGGLHEVCDHFAELVELIQ